MYLLVRIIHIIYITSAQLKIVPEKLRNHIFRSVRNNKLTNITIVLLRSVKLLLWRANEFSAYYYTIISRLYIFFHFCIISVLRTNYV